MDEIKLDQEERRFRPCPHCTIQIPENVVKCPHCELPVSREHTQEERRAGDERIDDVRSRGERKKRRYNLLVIVFLSLILIPIAGIRLYNFTFGAKIVVEPNSELPLKKVKVERSSDKSILRGVVINNLGDVPVFSLKSVIVKAEVKMKDGKVYEKTLFPLGPLNEPGALLEGDRGNFELDLPKRGVKEVRIRAELIDLGSNKKFYKPGRRRRRR